MFQVRTILNGKTEVSFKMIICEVGKLLRCVKNIPERNGSTTETPNFRVGNMTLAVGQENDNWGPIWGSEIHQQHGRLWELFHWYRSVLQWRRITASVVFKADV
jgi:hypothetical protein